MYWWTIKKHNADYWVIWMQDFITDVCTRISNGKLYVSTTEVMHRSCYHSHLPLSDIQCLNEYCDGSNLKNIIIMHVFKYSWHTRAGYQTYMNKTCSVSNKLKTSTESRSKFAKMNYFCKNISGNYSSVAFRQQNKLCYYIIPYHVSLYADRKQ